MIPKMRFTVQNTNYPIPTVELLPQMFAVQSIDYRYSRDDTKMSSTVQTIDYRYSRDNTEDVVYSTEYQLSLQ